MPDATTQTAADARDQIKFNDQGLLPAVVQDADTGEVLMMAWMNRAALDLTLQTGKTHFYSRSRDKMWLKGESSGHVQEVVDVRVDCDMDCILVRAHQHGAACHEGYKSCFFRTLTEGGRELSVNDERLVDPAEVYKK
ncbi:MAG: phosphoribosyl-AMP cyclohydrolase [Phycisphaerae bacterium]